MEKASSTQSKASSKVLILGGYGNFGKRIAELLTRQGISVIIAGRDLAKAKELIAKLPSGMADATALDISDRFGDALTKLNPAIVVHTCGPFQNGSFKVAEACIHHKIDYIDLADGRDFVPAIQSLHKQATRQGVVVVSGASTVPGLSSAVLEAYAPRFSSLESLAYGIAPGQRAERGLATTQAILSYIGRRLKPYAGNPVSYGWQDLHRQKYPVLGSRWMANCEVPDLDLLPATYNIRKIRFSAGMELSIIHLGIWLMSWVVRLGLSFNPVRHAPALLRASHWFDIFGTSNGGMHMVVRGQDRSARPLTLKWFIIALRGHGPYIPAVPAVVLVKRILAGKRKALIGARSCVGLVSLEEYRAELKHLDIRIYEKFSTPD